MLGTFERTLTMKNIVFPHAVKEGLTILFENDGAEQPITPLKEHLQSSMPHSFAKQSYMDT